MSYRPTIGYIQVRIFRPSVSNTIPYLDTGAVYVQPSAATAGRIGLYTYSQSAVTFDSVDFSCCDGFTDALGSCLSSIHCLPQWLSWSLPFHFQLQPHVRA